MSVIARRVPRWCDWLIRTFAADQPMRHGDAASAWAWESLRRENEELRRERNAYARAVEALREIKHVAAIEAPPVSDAVPAKVWKLAFDALNAIEGRS